MSIKNHLPERFLEWWPHTDDPGYSDYPEVDIKAHRSNAKWIRRIGVVVALMAFILGTQTGDVTNIYVGLAFGFFSLWVADRLRVEALEWEVRLLAQNED